MKIYYTTPFEKSLAHLGDAGRGSIAEFIKQLEYRDFETADELALRIEKTFKVDDQKDVWGTLLNGAIVFFRVQRFPEGVACVFLTTTIAPEYAFR